jgi:hypothetical protein
MAGILSIHTDRNLDELKIGNVVPDGMKLPQRGDSVAILAESLSRKPPLVRGKPLI